MQRKTKFQKHFGFLESLGGKLASEEQGEWRSICLKYSVLLLKKKEIKIWKEISNKFFVTSLIRWFWWREMSSLFIAALLWKERPEEWMSKERSYSMSVKRNFFSFSFFLSFFPLFLFSFFPKYWKKKSSYVVILPSLFF